MPRKWFFIILAIVVIPVSMTCWKIIQYARESKSQIFVLHRHIVHALSLNTTTYFEQLNVRLAFASTLSRTRLWGEQVALLNNALVSNNDFACIALLDANGKEHAKAFDSNLRFWSAPIDYSRNPLFQKMHEGDTADMGTVYERNGQTFFDILYPLESGEWLLVAVRWDALKNLLFDQQVGQKGYIWIVDETGRLVGDSLAQHYGDRLLPGWQFLKERAEEPKPWEGEFTDPYGAPSVGATQWIKGAGWFVLSAQPQAVAYVKIRQLRLSAFFWMFCSFLGMGVFGYFWVQHVSLPVTKLAAGVRRVAKREFEQSIPEDFSLEEFRALGRAFNGMMKELKSYEALQVEKIIEEHTTNQSLLLSIRDGIIMMDERNQILFTNEPARQWVIEVAGQNKTAFDKAWESLQEYPPWIDLLEPVSSKEQNSNSTEFEFPAQGRSRWARVLVQSVSTEKGRRLGEMIAIRDITQDKELDRMKEDFFNGITHDLRTPLAATIGYLGLSELQMPEKEEELAKLVGSARQSAKRALSLVETILSLARLQAGKLNLTKVPVQVHSLVSKIAGDLSFQASAKKITLTFECEDQSLWVNADASLLERVVENLAGNAIKYTPENGWVKLIGKATEGGAEIAIQDNGRGIPPEALKSLFGKFQQVKAEDRAVGFGIGLSFSKGIVEAHGSSIEVESEVGKGSKFFFVLERVAPQVKVKAA
jgi:PAS domain S-box-containing protein